MIYIRIDGDEVKLADVKDPDVQSRWDWKSYDHVQEIASKLTASENKLYIGIDRGPSVSPRFDIIEAPVVGDDVSYSFNGDTYPCGKITRISDSLRRIETDEGRVFYRRKQSGTWLHNRTWALVRGHEYEQNPHF